MTTPTRSGGPSTGGWAGSSASSSRPWRTRCRTWRTDPRERPSAPSRTPGVSRLCHDRPMPAATAKRVRLDQLLVERGLVPTRSRAQALVLAGRVRVGEGDAARHNLKAGDLVDREAVVDIAGGREWVSRGAHKLIAALDAFRIDPADQVAVDVGSSTGRFTDVLLARGAARVYAVDVGYGQLAEKLRANPRVVSMERL